MAKMNVKPLNHRTQWVLGDVGQLELPQEAAEPDPPQTATRRTVGGSLAARCETETTKGVQL
jgi:hypothetical protein